MYFISTCPACEATAFRSWPAVVAPFIAEFALGGEAPDCSLRECEHCGLRFFDPRLSDAEAGRLYGQYRGTAYYEARHRHEFWYTRTVNDGIGKDPREIASRTAACEAFLRQFLDPSSVQSVLDYGGDRGQFIPAALGRERFVLEISDAEPAPGITRLSGDGDVGARAFGLVMLCHVLEHHSDPAALLRRLKERLVAPSPWLYVEVPLERVSLRAAGRGEGYRRYASRLRRWRLAWTLVDFYSTACRVRWNVVPPLGVVKCHEHLNFFDERSLRALLGRVGFQVAGSRVVEVESASGLSRMVQALARSTSPEAPACRASLEAGPSEE